MTQPTRTSRSRLAAAGGLAMVFSLVVAPATMAQSDGPEQTVLDLLAAVEAKQFDSLGTYFCAEYADQAAGLDFSSMLPEGTDADALLAAFIIDTEATTEVLSQTDTEAVVKLTGTLSMQVDAEKLGPFIESMIVSMGQEPTPDMVEMMSGMIVSELQAEPTPLDDEITLVPGETMPWVICDELGGSDVASPEASMDAGSIAPASPEASPAA